MKIMEKLVNLTGADLKVLTVDGDLLSVPESVHPMPRVPFEGDTRMPYICVSTGSDSVAVISTGVCRKGMPIEMPKPVENYVYIVPRDVAEAVGKYRSDVCYPGPVTKDSRGHPIGCKWLCRPSNYVPPPREEDKEKAEL